MSKEYQILGTPPKQIIFGARGLVSIFQNIKTLLTTWRGEVFYNRDFGLDSRLIDQPINTVYADLIINITEQLIKYEPRVDIVSIAFTESDALEGRIVPLITFKVKNGVAL